LFNFITFQIRWRGWAERGRARLQRSEVPRRLVRPRQLHYMEYGGDHLSAANDQKSGALS
jgi:hypothetical protein